MSFPNLLDTRRPVPPWVGYRSLVEVGLAVKFNEVLKEE
jgi:hypothetical protein